MVVPPVSQSSSCDSPSPTFYPRDIRIEDGKLFFEKRWFRRGQAVLVEDRGGEKFAAMISNIGKFNWSFKSDVTNTMQFRKG